MMIDDVADYDISHDVNNCVLRPVHHYGYIRAIYDDVKTNIMMMTLIINS